MAEIMKGCKVIVRGQVTEVNYGTVIIQTAGGENIAVNEQEAEHVLGDGDCHDSALESPVGIPGVVTGEYGDGETPGITEPQLSFVVTKHWGRPEDAAGWNYQTCSKASFRRVLEWMCEELPAEAVRVRASMSGLGIQTVQIDWGKVPEGIRAPVIAPYSPESPEAAALRRVAALASGWIEHGKHHQPGYEGCDLGECGERIMTEISGEVPEPVEPQPGPEPGPAEWS